MHTLTSCTVDIITTFRPSQESISFITDRLVSRGLKPHSLTLTKVAETWELTIVQGLPGIWTKLLNMNLISLGYTWHYHQLGIYTWHHRLVIVDLGCILLFFESK